MRQTIGNTAMEASRIVLGCMRLSQLSRQDAASLIDTSLSHGINFFDHADIYDKGQSEIVFSQAMKDLGVKREDVLLQSKCGIRDGFYDFSKEHIIESTEKILSRLKTDYLDILLLHRPDALVEPEEVAEAFDQLRQQGKVKYFGVSNHNILQIQLLESFLTEKLVINQLQLSPAHTPLIDSGLHVNTLDDLGIVRDGHILDYCRLHRMTIQAWSPFLIDLTKGTFINHPTYEQLNDVLNDLANKHQVDIETIVVAWILRHPADIQTIVGTTQPKRLSAIAKASMIRLTREEWYAIYKSAGKSLP